MKEYIIRYSKRIALIGGVLLTIISCSNNKITAEFNGKKAQNEVTIIFRESKGVEKKKSLNNLFTRYLNDAPADSLLLDIINQYTLYYLFEKGYSNLLIAEPGDELPELTAYTYEIEMGNLELKEFKYHEAVSDSTATATDYIKLKGIETTLEANILPIMNTVRKVEFLKKAQSIVETTESQEGEFSTRRTIRDIAVGNKEGSTKYLADVNRLEDGIFENQCLEIAALIAFQIDEKIKLIYKKQRKL